MYCKVIVLVALIAASPALGQTILNGDLTGPQATGSAPPDWFNWQKTPDTVTATGPFNNTPNPWALSPNGGTFVRAGGSDFANSEAFAQNVTGFTPGVIYQLDMFVTNLGFEHPTSGDWIGQDGYWSVYIDGVLAGSTGVLSKPTLNTDSIAWVADSVSFVAPAAAFELALVSRSAGGALAAYMGIDGVSARAVPAPGAATVLALGLVAGGVRRRRSANA